ncbi:MAG TPA: membrane protein insertase YidC [Steroidobacteraceae bacterium]|nr:membrane protein insertase YidC [Steroidobacteraceae bacterium]
MTNNPRLFLWVALAMLVLLNYSAWNADYGTRTDNAPATSTGTTPNPTGGAPGTDLASQVPQAEKSAVTAPGTAAPGAATDSTAAAAIPGATADTATDNSGSVVHVRTDVLDLDISTRGGTLVRADLLKYPRIKGEAAPVRLENEDSPQSLYLLQSGLTGPQSAPSHLDTFASAQSDYRMGSADELRVPLTWTDDHGVRVTKTFVFRRGKYRIDVEYNIENHGDAPWTAAPYAQILRNDPRTKRSMFNVESYAFHGPAIWNGAKYHKLDTADKDDSHLAIDVNGGWIAALQHHFVSAIVPPKDQTYKFTLSTAGDQYRLAAAGPARTVAPGASATLDLALFVGPKLQDQLEATGTELQRVADYGLLTQLAKPLFLLLNWVHGISGNWGVAIIFVTFLLKLLFYPLSEASGRSMAKMKQLAPRIKNLQETYKDDTEKRGRAMMELYQREKINPLAGCLPIVIQIPVFLAFYWVLLESVEMRQAPFAFWIHDLSSRDPYFVLPAIMAAAMFVQYKLNPAPPDPVQAKVFMFMPLVMSFMFAFFPSGLVLYWVTNTILSIAQQWNINRRIAAADARKN